jgi:hypothetical protein
MDMKPPEIQSRGEWPQPYLLSQAFFAGYSRHKTISLNYSTWLAYLTRASSIGNTAAFDGPIIAAMRRVQG